MSCVHLKKLYALCAEEELKISGPELIRLVCTQCGEQEVCPSVLMEQYEATHPETETPVASESMESQSKP